MDKKHLAEALRSLRVESGLSQAEFARRMGISTSSASNIEAGKREPSIETISKWAETANRTLYLQFSKTAEGARATLRGEDLVRRLLSAGVERYALRCQMDADALEPRQLTRESEISTEMARIREELRSLLNDSPSCLDRRALDLLALYDASRDPDPDVAGPSARNFARLCLDAVRRYEDHVVYLMVRR